MDTEEENGDPLGNDIENDNADQSNPNGQDINHQNNDEKMKIDRSNGYNATITTTARKKRKQQKPKSKFRLFADQIGAFFRFLEELSPDRVIASFRTAQAQETRKFVVGDPANRKKYASNSISTTKYSILSFFPRFLFEQFGKPSNFFFLFTACISASGSISIIPPAIAVSPLLIVLCISGIKELYEDFVRYQADKKANSHPVLAFRNGKFTLVQWKDVIVGDIIKIEEEDQICADIFLLSSSNNDGISYVETASLDGETNLKLRQCKLETKRVQTAEEISKIQITFECEPPNNRLYTFDGNVVFHQTNSPRADTDMRLSVTPNETILRGCTLRNTSWIIGIPFFTGHETKLFQNAHAAPIKRSGLQISLNRQISILFLVILTLTIVTVIGRLSQPQGADHWYLLPGIQDPSQFLQFLSSILLVQNIIPISLFVQLEIARFVQGWYISSDNKMFYQPKQFSAKARTTNLNEDLGQISYIFSDKTGTLTQNKMIFRACAVNGRVYNQFNTNIEEFEGEEFIKDFKIQKADGDETLYLFLLTLALCHTVIPQVKRSDNGESYIEYQASSPDEYALVKAAAALGFVVKNKLPGSLNVEIEGKENSFEICQINEFNSTRKRMSIVCKTPQGRIFLFCKGADDTIAARLTKDDASLFKQFTEQHLKDFSKVGLRTLCLAYRELTKEEYNDWTKMHHEASTSLTNRQELLEEAAEKIEKGMKNLGCTAIEDKLQDGVPETLALFGQAGIKVWVLTGDKQETAINIGLSSNVLKPEMDLLICDGDEDWLYEFLSKQLKEHTDNNTPPEKLGLVINGATLIHAFHEDIQRLFFEMANRCGAVICCRVSPLQKAKVVLLVKEHTNNPDLGDDEDNFNGNTAAKNQTHGKPKNGQNKAKKQKRVLTLAVGDGANDVSMIQAANIGVGIQGEEGSQAARSSDFAIGQFKYLQRLLFVHGTWSFHRQTQLIFYQFYIQIIFNFITFYFQSLDQFSLQTIYQPLLQTLYYTVFTGLPILFSAILFKHLSESLIFDYPQAYKNNVINSPFSIVQFWSKLVIGICHTLVIFLIVENVYKEMNFSLWLFGSTMYTCVMLTVTYILFLQTPRFTIIEILALLLSLIFYLSLQYFVSTINSQLFYNYLGMFHIVGKSFASWLIYLLVPTTVLLLHLGLLYIKAYHFPDDLQILNEIGYFSSTKTIKMFQNLEGMF